MYGIHLSISHQERRAKNAHQSIIQLWWREHSFGLFWLLPGSLLMLTCLTGIFFFKVATICPKMLLKLPYALSFPGLFLLLPLSGLLDSKKRKHEKTSSGLEKEISLYFSSFWFWEGFVFLAFICLLYFFGAVYVGFIYSFIAIFPLCVCLGVCAFPV